MRKYGNFLVTGGNGFIGSHLVDRLAETPDHDVTVFDLFPRSIGNHYQNTRFIQGDLHDLELLERTVRDQGIEVVYHLSWAGIHESSLEDPVRDIESNLIPSLRLLEACRKSGVERVVFISSGGTVYGIPRYLPIDEGHPTSPISAYGITKLAVEKYVEMYTHLYGLDHVIFRPSVPYGPRQNPRRRQGAVSVFTYSALMGEPITIWGDGSVRRDFFYIDDLIDAMLAASESEPAMNTTMNIGGSEAFSLNDLLEVIEDVLGVEIKVNHEAGRGFDVPTIDLDSSRAKELLGWSPKIDLRDGIERTAHWISDWMDQ